ncbi:MAG TPA: zinc ribbon domain-containing protein [Pyrinomonadaceae bacterium]|jgi:plasmid stabilization system protein ParE
MWECQHCGEDENEDTYNFCLACGAPPLNLSADPAAEEEIKMAFNNFIDDAPRQNGERYTDETGATERRWHMPKSLSAIGQKMKGVLPINSGDINHVKLSPAAQDKIEDLVHAGVFDSKAEAAAYLIEQGIKAESSLFDVVEQKLSEIERLRAELRNLVRGNRK